MSFVRFHITSRSSIGIEHPEAKLEAVVDYGKPELFSGEDYKSFHDIIKYTKGLKAKMGRLESLFPTAFLFRVIGVNTKMALADL